jgi:histone deacetylase HOS2
MVVGGGGYTVRNVARCWTYETSVLVDTELSENLPPNEYREFFKPDYKLHPDLKGRVENQNDRRYLLKVRERVMEQLRYLDAAPSIQMQEIPPDIQGFLDGEAEQRDARNDSVRGKERRTLSRRYQEDWYEDDADNDDKWMDVD